MDSYLLATVDVRVVGDEVGGAADEQVEADDVAEEEEARVPVGQEEAREVEHLVSEGLGVGLGLG